MTEFPSFKDVLKYSISSTQQALSSLNITKELLPLVWFIQSVTIFEIHEKNEDLVPLDKPWS